MRLCRKALIIAALLAVATVPTCGGSRSPRFEYDFEEREVLDTLEWKCRTLLAVSPDHATSGRRSLEISFFPAAGGDTGNYPGISFSSFAPDWTGHRALLFDVFNPEEATSPLILRIDDRQSLDYADRYNRSLPLVPGMNRIAIPLTELIASRTKRPLNRQTIRQVVLYLANPRERSTLYIDHIRLE